MPNLRSLVRRARLVRSGVRHPGLLSGLLLVGLLGGCQGGEAPAEGAAQSAGKGGKGGPGRGGPGGKGGPGRGGPGSADGGTAAPVEVVALESGTISDGIESTATVEARLSAALRAGTSGTLGMFTLDEGDPVTAGQLLLRIDRPGTVGSLAKARAQVAKARADARALKKLSAEGLVPGQQQEDAEFTLRQTELEVDQLTQERELEKVTSPIQGVITARHVQPGEAISAGAALFQVADLSTLEAHFRVPERHIARLRPGLPVEVTAEGVSTQRRMATIDRIAPVVDPASGTIKVTVALGDGAVDAGPRLRPGMYIRARLVIDTRENAVRVPKRALVREDERVFVFRVTGEGDAASAEKVAVQVGYADRDVVEAREGLAAGDAVVVFGQRGLADGARVRVVRAPTIEPATPASAAPSSTAPSSTAASGAVPPSTSASGAAPASEAGSVAAPNHPAPAPKGAGRRRPSAP